MRIVSLRVAAIGRRPAFDFRVFAPDASAALDALTAMSPAGVDSAERNLQIDAAAAVQRTAFEDYIEARLQL